MIIFVPHTTLDDTVVPALEATRGDDVLSVVSVEGRLERYWEAFAEHWKRAIDEKQDLVCIEHDIEVHSGVLQGFRTCDELWCVHPYTHRNGEHAPALGCVRFRWQLMADNADLLEWIGTWSQIGAKVNDLSRPRIWMVLDTRIHRALSDHVLREESGRVGYVQWHVHASPVAHHMER